MINLFKKTVPQYILWDTEEKSTRDTQVSDYLIPTNKLKPKWYSNLKPTIDDASGISNVKSCPSFHQIFKDSYTFISPCDLEIEVGRYGYNLLSADSVWFRSSSHTHISGKKSQMGDEWDKDFYNIKLGANIILATNKSKLTVLNLHSYYHTPRTSLIIPPGVYNLTKEIPLQLNLNIFVDIKDLSEAGTKKILVKKGDPLALFYIPEGFKSMKKANLKTLPRRFFVGDYMKSIKELGKKKKQKKCPFH